MDDKYIPVHEGLGVSQQRQLMELTRGLMAALTEDEFIQIVGVYNKAITRLIKQARKEEIEV